MTIDKNMQQSAAKDAASKRALELVEEGMVLGLGTGSTSRFFIEHLIDRCKAGLKIHAVATSVASARLASKGGIPMLDINTLSSLDMTVDGADEIDPQRRLIKGAGGALLREKIIAKMSREMVVIADESKLVSTLGGRPLPIEVVPFGIEATKTQMQNLGYPGTWRMKEEGTFFVTDNGNYIFDVTLQGCSKSPEAIHSELLQLPGVVETGFFLGIAGRVIIGKSDGSVDIQT